MTSVFLIMCLLLLFKLIVYGVCLPLPCYKGNALLSVAVAAAGVLVRAFSGQVPDALDPARRIENKLGERAVYILAPQAEKVGVFVVFDGELAAVDLPGLRVGDLDGHAVSGKLEKLLVNGNRPPFINILLRLYDTLQKSEVSSYNKKQFAEHANCFL